MKSPLPHRAFVGVVLGGVLAAAATVPASGAAGHHATSRVTTTTSTRTLIGALATSPHSNVVFGLRQRDVGHSGRSMSLLRREHGKWSSLPGRVVVRRNNEFVGPKLFDLAPLSASDVWLIGESTTTGVEAIFHYNGVRFRKVKFPPLGSIKPIDVTLFGIVARSRNDVTVTGSAFDSSTRRAVPLLFHFDGARWARVQNNELSDYYSLGDVTAARNGRGIWTIASGNSGYSLLHINGAHVSGFPVPRTVRLLQSIAAGGGRVWAIGVHTNVTNGEGSFPADRSYAVFWHGGKVRVVTPPRGKRSLALDGVTAVSGSSAVAVGWAGFLASEQEKPVAYRWSDGSWRSMKAPHTGPVSTFGSVARLPHGRAIAAGYISKKYDRPPYGSLTGIFNGHAIVRASS